MKQNFSKGLSLIEVLITVGILALVLLGLLQLFIYCANLGEIAGGMTFAISEAQGKLEEIRNHKFDDIADDYGTGGIPGNVFNLVHLNGTGVIYIDDSDSQLLEVEIVVTHRTKEGRIIGEDTDLNGQLDAGEDDNGNGKLDSSVSLATMIARR